MNFNKILKIMSSTFAVVMLANIFAGCNAQKPNETAPKYDIELNAHSGKEIDLAHSTVRNYINAANNEDLLAFRLNSYYQQYLQDKHSMTFYDNQNISFSWKDTGKTEKFTLHFAYDKDFSDELFTYETNKNSVDELGVFIPGKTYYYKVVGSQSGESMVDSFKTKDSPVRYITSGAVLNMRDIGGWTTADGKKVKYGMMYRGGALDGSEHPEGPNYILERGSSRLDAMGLKVFNDYLKIKSEIDLRGVAEDQHETPTFGGSATNMCQYAGAAASAVWSNPEDATLKKAIKSYFTFMANENNYPIYFHCNGGADRTGALAFLVNGLLGVDYKYLAVDYELTTFSFAAGGKRNRSELKNGADGAYFEEVDIRNSVNAAAAYCKALLLSKYPDANGDLQVAIEKYLTTSCGVTKSEISKIRSIMLEA